MSTKILQLASLPFCIACRSISTLHVTVGKNTPRRLWVTPAEQPSTPTSESRRRYHQGSDSSLVRLPFLRARGVMWKSCASAKFMSCENDILANLERVKFSPAFTRSLESVIWPQGVKIIIFDERGLGETSKYNQPIENVEWPASLQQLAFGSKFNQPIKWVRWPASLQRLAFGKEFNQPIDGVLWPASLQQLEFGYNFNQPIERLMWPTSLQEVLFGWEFNQPIEGVVWPTFLKRITFGYSFNQPIGGVGWPTSLQQLTFGRLCN